jgi:hypothetical protein
MSQSTLPFAGQVFVISADVSSPLMIDNFDTSKDILQIAGTLAEYTTTTVDGNLQISTLDGKLLATVAGVSELKPYTGNNPEGESYLLSLENEFFEENIEPYFYEPIYPVQNPDVDALIAEGKYTSYYDHLLKAGQFEEREDTFLVGTSGDDTLYGLGSESVLVGVPISDAAYDPLAIQPIDTGVGQQDTLVGSSDRNIFLLGSGKRLDETPQLFYVGEGDNDYARIQNFDPLLDYIVLTGRPEDLKFETVDGDSYISTKEGDLVAIVEDIPKLLPDYIDPTEGTTNIYAYVPNDPYYAEVTQAFFIEDAYLEANPDVSAAVTAGQYQSGFDHFINVGIYENREVVYQGTEGDDYISPSGNSFVFGVPVTKFDLETETFEVSSTGAGQVDELDSSSGANRFVLGAQGSPFYVGSGDADYAKIPAFDTQEDSLLLAGSLSDYTLEYAGNNLKISTKEGDLVAIVTEGVTDESITSRPLELKAFTGSNPDGFTSLLSLENEFFAENVEPAFYAPYYSVQNPDVDALIAEGKYTSYYDHFLKAGQFEQREDTFFQGTEADDTLFSIGWESILVGVPITDAEYEEGLDVVPVNTGTGQIDTLIGNGVDQKETIFVLGNGTVLNETSQTFYLGEGDADYALIQNFQNRDRIYLGSDVSEFTLETIDGDVHISKAGDLVAIVEDRTELLSARENELAAPQIEFFTPGTAGNDTLYSAVRQNYLVGVEISAGQVIGKTYPDVVPVSTGTGEVDTLHGLLGREDTFLLGTSGLLNETAQPFYVGQGDADYALIKDFSPNDQYDTVILAGEVSDYRFEIQSYEGTGDDTKIYTKDGDLIAIVEGATLSQAYDNDNGKSLTLYASNLNGSAEAAAEYFSDVEPVFYEDFYLDKNPEVAALISSGEFGSAFEHYLEVGQFTGEGEVIIAGTSDNDALYGLGKSDLLFGVPLTFVDGEKEAWTSSTTGVGEQDTLGGGLGVTTFFIGNDQLLDSSKPSEVYYVGKGDADYALIQGFQPTQDFIFAAGAIADYTLETVDGDGKISYGGDLVAIVDDIGDLTLQEFSFGNERPNAFAFVAPQNQFLTAG